MSKAAVESPETIRPGGLITVAIVEDDAAVRSSLQQILKAASDVRCVAAYGSAEEAIRALPKLAPKVAILDINLPGMSGVECVRHLAEGSPETQIMMLTVYDHNDAIFDSLSAGAHGYLVKPVRAAELLAAVRDVHAGGAPMTSNIARRVVQAFKKPAGPARSGMEHLSEREAEVLALLAQGYLYKEIAAKVGVSYHTIHAHVRHIYEKLHVRSRGQAVALYNRRG
ncbi:MAG: response regulator transcription factor [Planctomycetia bacterium]|jgi:DNA-binding NarL/FixJ family response regulator|nr:response regulator transcription factor [Planctomycetia bacterium]